MYILNFRNIDYKKRHLRITDTKLHNRDIENTPLKIMIVHNGLSLPDLNKTWFNGIFHFGTGTLAF